MPDVKDFAPNNPVYQKESPQPKYKTMWFNGYLEDDRENEYAHTFIGSYYEFDNAIRFVEAVVVTGIIDKPIIPQDELQNIIRIDIREELNTDYQIIFETNIELK